MNNKNYEFSFTSFKNLDEVFAHLVNPENWWQGLFNETIEGKSYAISDEFNFKAGDGVHFSNQKLIELIPHEKIVWQPGK